MHYTAYNEQQLFFIYSSPFSQINNENNIICGIQQNTDEGTHQDCDALT